MKTTQKNYRFNLKVMAADLCLYFGLVPYLIKLLGMTNLCFILIKRNKLFNPISLICIVSSDFWFSFLNMIMVCLNVENSPFIQEMQSSLGHYNPKTQFYVEETPVVSFFRICLSWRRYLTIRRSPLCISKYKVFPQTVSF